MQITRCLRVMGRSGRREAACLMAGALFGALSYTTTARAGEAADFTGPYAGFNLGYGVQGARERITAPPTLDRGLAADPVLPPSAAAAARGLRVGRGAASHASPPR